MTLRGIARSGACLLLGIAACGPDRSIDEFPTMLDASPDRAIDAATDSRADASLDHALDSQGDVLDSMAPDAVVADAVQDAPSDLVADAARDVMTDVASDVLNDAGSPDVVVIVDAADPCVGLDVRPDLNANSVPDCRENLLVNSQFANSVLHWMPTSRATIVWSATDALAFPTSGSALVTDIVASTTVNGGSVDSDCISVTASTNYGIYSQYWMASGEPGGDASASTWVTVQTYLDGACVTPYAGLSGGALGTTKDSWAIYTRHMTTGATEHSIRLSLGVLKGATASPVSANFDNVLLVRE